MWRVLLVCIVCLAFVLRVDSLTLHPGGFTPDEASFGYDAYSLLLTGKDQWGAPWPLTLKSFGDYKLPLYSYLTIPFVAALGLNEQAVRLPNAILGTFAVVVIYFLSLEICKKFLNLKYAHEVSLLSALLLAVSPWHIPLSRGAFEANLTTFLLPLGVLFFLKGVKNHKFFIFSALFLGLNLFSYHSARLVTPLVAIALLIQFSKQVSLKSVSVIVSSIIAFIFTVMLFTSLSSGGGNRFFTSTIFGTDTTYGNNRFVAIQSGFSPIISFLVFNKPFYLTEQFSENYVRYFSPEFLVSKGAGEGTYGMLPGIGVLTVIEFLGFLITLVLIIRRVVKVPAWLIFLLVVAPIPAALSIGPGYAANRASILMPFMQFMSALGLVFLVHSLNRKLQQYGRVTIFGLCLLFGLSSFAVWWYMEPVNEGKGMLSGIAAALANVKGEKVIISKSISEPHIYYAFYNKLDPTFYQQEAKEWTIAENTQWVDQIPVYTLGNATFQPIDWIRESYLHNVSLVATAQETPPNIQASYVSRLPDGSPVFTVTNIP